MASKQPNGVELIFKLKWVDRPDNGDSCKSNVIGMYDTPDTTQNFETFTSYLMKNSGVSGNVLRVAFIIEEGKEWRIESQAGFDIALCTFRLKARLGEVIHLKVARTTEALKRSNSRDIETQFDNKTLEMLSYKTFDEYMQTFRDEIMDDFETVVQKNKVVNQPLPTQSMICPRKHRTDAKKVKRENITDKELLRTLKYDKKLEHKLDKLDAKTRKIKEKKQALLVHKFDDVSVEEMNGALYRQKTATPRMLGGEVYVHSWIIVNNGRVQWKPGTELRQTWGSTELKPAVKVIKCPCLEPGEKITIYVQFEIPKKPGRYESYWNFFLNEYRFGESVHLGICVDPPRIFPPSLSIASTKICGSYETLPKEQIKCSLDSSLHLLPFPVSNDDTDQKALCQELSNLGLYEASDSDWEALKSDLDINSVKRSYGIAERELEIDVPKKENESRDDKVEEHGQQQSMEGAYALITENIQKNENAISPQDDDDNNNNNKQAVTRNSSSESICQLGSEVSSELSEGFDVVNAVEAEKKEDNDYVFVTVDGNKISLPKYMLNPEYITPDVNAQESDLLLDCVTLPPAPIPQEEILKTEETPKPLAESSILDQSQNVLQTEPKSFVSHCSAAGTCFSEANQSQCTSRLFIFPQGNAGYEFIPPTSKTENAVDENAFCPTNKVEVLPSDPLQTYTWAHSQTQYTLSDLQQNTPLDMRYNPHTPLEKSRSNSAAGSSTNSSRFEPVPNYQQTHRTRSFHDFQPSCPQPEPTYTTAGTSYAAASSNNVGTGGVHILPENLVSGAVNVASSAINTARSVINMIVPPKSEPGKWINGHWVTEDTKSKRAQSLKLLSDMGFWDHDLNATLLARYNDDVTSVVNELLL